MIDIEELRRFLIDYCGTGMTVLSYPGPNIQGPGVIAMGYLSEIETAAPDRLIEIASDLGVI